MNHGTIMPIRLEIVMDEAAAIGRAIEAEMVARGMSRKEFAAAVDMSEASMGEYIRGEREPSLQKLRIFAAALSNCSVGYLIARQEEILGWTRGGGSVKQAIVDAAGNVQVASAGISGSAGDTSAEDQGVAVAGFTAAGDVNIVVPPKDDEGQDDQSKSSDQAG